MQAKEKDWYRTGEAATLLGVAERTLAMWVQQGKVEVSRTLGGHARISTAEVERLREWMRELERVRQQEMKRR